MLQIILSLRGLLLPGIFFLKNSSADWHKTPDVIKRSGPDQALPVASGLQLAVKPGGQAVDHKVSGFACPLRRSHGTEVGLGG